MTKEELISITTQFINANQHEKSFAAIRQYMNGTDRDRELEVNLLLLTSSFNRSQNDFETGMITKEDYNVALARSKNAIINFVDRLPGQGTPPPSTRKILFLSANPSNQSKTTSGKELRKIKDEILKASQRDNFLLEEESAVTVSTIMRALKVKQPEIVHFSGHGTGEEGIVVEDDIGNTMLFPTDGLNRLFRQHKETVKCVVLNACFSQEQAEVISRHGMYVVGMNQALDNEAAVDFSKGFYLSLGEGSSYEEAFDDGLVLISSHTNDANTPELWLNGEKCDI